MANKSSNTVTGVSTQSFLRIAEIRDDLVIMNDGTLRAVVAVSSTNFDLKNEDEQNALIAAYQRFLNSLDFEIQILMQSRKLNVGPYLEMLKGVMHKQTNELLKTQTQSYLDFVTELIDQANVMSKNFYVVVPYSQSINPPTPGFFARLFGGTQQSVKKIENLKHYAGLLDQHVVSVLSGLSGLGLRGLRLSGPALVELFYNSYNFEAAPMLDGGQLQAFKLADKPNVTS